MPLVESRQQAGDGGGATTSRGKEERASKRASQREAHTNKQRARERESERASERERARARARARERARERERARARERESARERQRARERESERARENRVTQHENPAGPPPSVLDAVLCALQMLPALPFVAPPRGAAVAALDFAQLYYTVMRLQIFKSGTGTTYCKQISSKPLLKKRSIKADCIRFDTEKGL